MLGIASGLLALAVQAQPIPAERDALKQLRALAAAKDEAEREAALKPLDEIPLLRLFAVESHASREGGEVLRAYLRWMPHRAWNMVLTRGTVGEARKREAEIFGPEGKVRPGDFAKGVAKLLEKQDEESRRTALRLFTQVRPPEPVKLVPFLSSPLPELVGWAATALADADDPAIAKELLKAFRSATPELSSRLVPTVGRALGAEGTPELLELLKSDPARERAAVAALAACADARAEAALLEVLPRLEKDDFYTAVRTLGLIGGATSVAGIRKVRDGLPEADPRREYCVRALLRLRAPGIAAEYVAQLREGKAQVALYDHRLLALGDRSVGPALAAWAKDKAAKRDGRKEAIGLLGLLGGPEHFELLLELLQDETLEGAAAKALGELGDPRAARPLAEVLKQREHGGEVAKALLALPGPLKDLDEPLLEMLNDPEGHRFVVQDALRLVARAPGPRVKAKALEYLAGKVKGFYGLDRVAWDLLPLVQPSDREKLAGGGAAAKIALASLGEDAAVKEFVRLAARREAGNRDDYERNVLFRFPAPPQGLLEAVEAAFKADPKWFEGAEFLAHHGKREGIEVLREKSRGGQGWESRRAARALLALGERPAVAELLAKYEVFNVDPEEESTLAAAMDEEAAARLREIAWANLRTNHPAGRVLARRADRAMMPLYRTVLRAEYGDNEVSEQMNDGEMAVALAKLGAKDVMPVFLRWLRSDAASRRALASRCLAILGDRAAIPAIVPLLDDLGLIRPSDGRMDREAPIVRVREAAADALEVFASRKFEGTPAARAAAARAWAVGK
jgi:HEAT repeat protein